jgi:cyclopropane-fatty-acyl-phospholipid synthase
MLRNRLLDFMRVRFGNGAPPLRLVFPDRETFNFTPNPTVTITFHSTEPLKALLRGDFARAADAYVAGQISVDGPIETVLKVGISLAEKLGRFSAMSGLARMVALLPVVSSRTRDAANISHHYDVGNEFYRLWLDRRMIYSCAYFRSGDEISTPPSNRSWTISVRNYCCGLANGCLTSVADGAGCCNGRQTITASKGLA